MFFRERVNRRAGESGGRRVSCVVRVCVCWRVRLGLGMKPETEALGFSSKCGIGHLNFQLKVRLLQKTQMLAV